MTSNLSGRVGYSFNTPTGRIYRVTSTIGVAPTQVEDSVTSTVEQSKIVNDLAINAEQTFSSLKISSEISAEQARAEGVEAQLSTDISFEEARAIDVENALGGEIAGESARALTAEGQLQQSIAAEAVRATAAESVLQTAISDEAARASQEEGIISTAIANEVTRATQQESLLSSSITSVQNQIPPVDDALNPSSGAVWTATFTKTQIDNAAAGIVARSSCAAGTISALPAVTATPTTLTASVNGAFPVVDALSLTVGARLLVKDQANAVENGIYEVTDLGSGATPFILTRSSDCDGAPDHEVKTGVFTYVSGGATNADTSWVVSSGTPAITVGTDNIDWAQFTGATNISAGTGISVNGSIISTAAPTTSDNAPSTFSAVKTFAVSPVISTITNGAATVSLPSVTSTLSTLDGAETLSNKTLNAGSGTSINATLLTSGTVSDSVLPTTLSNKTLVSPSFSTIVNGGTVTVPSGTATLVTTTGGQTLTNKLIRATNGVATNPNYSFSGDTTAGMYRSGVNGELNFSSGGTADTRLTLGATTTFSRSTPNTNFFVQTEATNSAIQSVKSLVAAAPTLGMGAVATPNTGVIGAVSGDSFINAGFSNTVTGRKMHLAVLGITKAAVSTDGFQIGSLGTFLKGVYCGNGTTTPLAAGSILINHGLAISGNQHVMFTWDGAVQDPVSKVSIMPGQVTSNSFRLYYSSATSVSTAYSWTIFVF